MIRTPRDPASAPEALASPAGPGAIRGSFVGRAPPGKPQWALAACERLPDRSGLGPRFPMQLYRVQTDLLDHPGDLLGRHIPEDTHGKGRPRGCVSPICGRAYPPPGSPGNTIDQHPSGGRGEPARARSEDEAKRPSAEVPSQDGIL